MIEVVKFNENMHGFWDKFVMQANNGTIFHERKFLNYHPKGRFKDHSLVFMEKGKPIALFPAVESMVEGKLTLYSHRGSSYGGIVQPLNQGVEKNVKIVKTLGKYAKENGFNSIMMTLPPNIYNLQLNNYLEFACFREGYIYLKREISSVLKLEDHIDKNLAKFKSTHRTAYRRGEKMGVIVRETDDYKAFYAILKNNLKIRHGVEPTHTLEELKKLKGLYPDRIRLYGAYLDNTLIAGIVMFDTNDLVTLAFYISHDEAFQEYRGVNVLFKEVIADSIKRGFHYLDYGIFTVNMEPNYGLARFKESFGSGGVFRDTLKFDF
ncbi:MAG: GNAT family N-acetyltransferase [Candidatus Marinimicrobia bacterium]|nr:GNAT family N-acetyltransferase [Candidatus Neomarinimicrobiota bacterium]